MTTTATTQGLTWEYKRAAYGTNDGFGWELWQAGSGAVALEVSRPIERPDSWLWLEVRFDTHDDLGMQLEGPVGPFRTVEEAQAAGERIAARLNRMLEATG